MGVSQGKGQKMPHGVTMGRWVTGCTGLVFDKYGHGPSDANKGHINDKDHSRVPSGEDQGDNGRNDNGAHCFSPLSMASKITFLS